ncbi:MAG: DEAD/DEAH box helicase [Synergistaceae bacterium]|nr:DEAD/DEAH box helicase [Synergistaceae bacterium]
MFYKWQNEAIIAIGENSAILSAPTGSGKTWVAYVWAGLMNLNSEPIMPSRRVIFTAPIKALSNERYLELKSMGFDVGIETGDFKKNAQASVLCCTQEIYTLKYADIPDQKVIIDEFHFIFNDPERARSYIDGLRSTSFRSDVLVMSATFGNPERVKKYLEKMGMREFVLYKTDSRVTDLVFKKSGLRFKEIHDALVFVFSKKGGEWLASQISRTRKKINREHTERLREMADILEVKTIHETMLRGVGLYFGSLLPKEKLLVEMAFRERILDVVVGSDALSLGVNLPAETVVFGQMAKFIDGPLTKNEFMQMAGRAGRKGYFNPGYVTYVPRSKAENYDYDTGRLYLETLDKPCEEARICLLPSVGRLLKKEVTIEVEAKMISECSLPPFRYKNAVKQVDKVLKHVSLTLHQIKDQRQRKKVRRIVADIWSDEMEVEQNIEIACMFADFVTPDAMMVADVLRRTERNYLQALLKVKRFANRLPKEYRFHGMEQIDITVNKIDASVFGFEEKIQRIKITEDIENVK